MAVGGAQGARPHAPLLWSKSGALREEVAICVTAASFHPHAPAVSAVPPAAGWGLRAAAAAQVFAARHRACPPQQGRRQRAAAGRGRGVPSEGLCNHCGRWAAPGGRGWGGGCCCSWGGKPRLHATCKDVHHAWKALAPTAAPHPLPAPLFHPPGPAHRAAPGSSTPPAPPPCFLPRLPQWTTCLTRAWMSP